MSFSSAVSYFAGAAPQMLATEVVTADLNNDGKLDLATANVYSQVSVLLGNGAGGFAAAQQFNGGNQTDSLAVGDLNKDGNIDLVTTEAYTGRVSILYGEGDGTFQSPVYKNTYAYPVAVAVGDVDSDGNLDIVVREEDLEPSGWVQALLGNGAGDFSAAPPAPSVFIGSGLTVGDVNGDSRLDVVAVGDHEAHDGYVLLGGGDGTLQSWSPWLTAQHPTDVAIGDFTGDGDPDLIVSAQSVALGRGTGDGQFEYLDDGYAANGSSHAGVVTGDFNGDGKLDAVVSDLDTNTVSIMLGNNDGTLRYAGAFAAGSAPTGITAGDFNRDGRLDVAVAGFNSGSNTVSVLLNAGNWATKNYVGPTGGNWSTASSWSPSGVPTASDFVSVTGKSVNLSANVTVASLTLTGGATMTLEADGNRVLRTSSSSIGSDSTLNLNDNALILDYSGASPVASIRAALQSGYANGAWNGAGINSSTAGSSAGRSIGFAEASELFSSFPASFADQNVDDTAVLVRYTSLGDANLDQEVDVSDLGTLATNWQQAPRRWSQGDFNYDGSVDVADLGFLATNWQQHLPTSVASVAQSPVQQLKRIDVTNLIDLDGASARSQTVELKTKP